VAVERLSAACSAFQMNGMTAQMVFESANMVNEQCQILVESNPDSTSKSFGNNVVMNVAIDATADITVACEHIAAHFSKGNRVRTTITNFMKEDPIAIGAIAGKACDAGSEEVFLANKPGDEVDDLVMVIEEVTYVDAPGGPMLGRLGLTYINEEEFLEEAIDTLGVAKYNLHINDVDNLLQMAKGRGLEHDISDVALLQA
jgi:hypothetical protein